jgi:lysophospholipase L1-like esterase
VLATVTVVVTLVICVAIGEGLARLTDAHAFKLRIRQPDETTRWSRPDPVLGWRSNPGVHPAHEGPREPMTILPDGSRSTGTPADASGPTVLLVGDSYTEGYGVRDDDAWAWKLQRRFPQVRLLNFGTPGYGTYQSLQLLHELLDQRRLRPALVIYGFIPFHAGRNVLTYYHLNAFRAFGGDRFSPPHVELRDGRLVEFPPFAVPNWPAEDSSALVALAHSAQLRVRMGDRERQQEEVTVRLIREMAAFVNQHGAQFLVATLSEDGPPGPDAYARMAQAIHDAGIDEVNFTYRGTETRPEMLRVPGGLHPGLAVQAWWTERLGDWLAEQLPHLPSPSG